MKRIRVAIIGTGNIGTDLCERMLIDSNFEVVSFIGRRSDSPGLTRFEGRVKHLLYDGINDLERIINEVDGVFDATSATSHWENWQVTKSAGKWIIDLTPSKMGIPVVPQLINRIPEMKVTGKIAQNFSMVTCGGQSGAPLVFAFASSSKNLLSLEISSSIAAKSAGPATRNNIDQYIDSTENLMKLIAGISSVKAILVLNPAEPPVMMRTTVTVEADQIDLEMAKSKLQELVNEIQKYVPGYEITIEPKVLKSGLVTSTVRVRGSGYYLPEFAGNLDIINAAAVQTAKHHAFLMMDS